jgi:hypothetical protein
MRTGFGLPGSADQLIAYSARWKQFGFLAEALGFFGKASFKGRDWVRSTATLHDVFPCACGS